MTILQLAITHLFLLLGASLTRLLGGFFDLLGLGAVVAPSQPHTRGNKHAKHVRDQHRSSFLRGLGVWLSHSTGGIAGGGLFEFDVQTAKHVLPVAIVFVAKVVLSNLSYAYALFPSSILYSR